MIRKILCWLGFKEINPYDMTKYAEIARKIERERSEMSKSTLVEIAAEHGEATTIDMRGVRFVQAKDTNIPAVGDKLEWWSNQLIVVWGPNEVFITTWKNDSLKRDLAYKKITQKLREMKQ